jgi:hypothetical protein
VACNLEVLSQAGIVTQELGIHRNVVLGTPPSQKISPNRHNALGLHSQDFVALLCFVFQFNVRPGRLEQLCRRLAEMALYLYYVHSVVLAYPEERLR